MTDIGEIKAGLAAARERSPDAVLMWTHFYGDELIKRLGTAEEALAFYADVQSWADRDAPGTLIDVDGGAHARAVLGDQ